MDKICCKPVVSGSLHLQKTFESKKTRDVSHCGLAIYIKKYLKAKEELCKLKYFTMQTYNLQKKIL